MGWARSGWIALAASLLLAGSAWGQGAPPDQARLARFLDARGGYTDKLGGRYDPNAGTYTDKGGGVVDNWQGYSYPDGSYKSANGDYMDGPKRHVSLASGDKFDMPSDMARADVIGILRGSVEDAHKYDPNYIRKTMWRQIQAEHPGP